MKEMQKPLARYIDDQDLDQMLREQEREGDPMAGFIRRRKAQEGKEAKGQQRLLWKTRGRNCLENLVLCCSSRFSQEQCQGVTYGEGGRAVT